MKDYYRKNIRKYFSSRKEGTYQPQSVVRVACLGALCRALDRRIDAIPREKWDEPAPGTLPEFGYTDEIERRFPEHRRHFSSNYLMNIIDALSRFYFGEKYELKQFVVYHIPTLSLVELSEIYFTRASQGYSSNGGGLSHYGAGRSTDSRKSYDNDDYETFWQHAKDTTMDTNIKEWERHVDAKTEEEMQLAEQSRREMDSKTAQVQKHRDLEEKWSAIADPLPEEVETTTFLNGLVDGLKEIQTFVDTHLDGEEWP